MKKEFFIGRCLICHYGMLEIVKEKATGKIFIACDECEAEWANPEDALINKNGSRGKYGAVSEVSADEINGLRWNSYVK
jgi:hypothetical protein